MIDNTYLQHEEFAITEPSSTSVLEECTIQGYGKFTALSNGQIRVAFADRTCLDMTCDLSQRISKSCDQNTSSGTVQVICYLNKFVPACFETTLSLKLNVILTENKKSLPVQCKFLNIC